MWPRLVHIHPRSFWAFPRIVPVDATKPDSAFAPSDTVLFRRSTHKDEGETVFQMDNAERAKSAYFASVCVLPRIKGHSLPYQIHI